MDEVFLEGMERDAKVVEDEYKMYEKISEEQFVHLDIKPLSANKAWRGRKFKTDQYKNYERDLILYHLQERLYVPDGKLQVAYIFGVSSKLSDWDNPIKQFQDVLCKRYKFDDRRIYKAIVEKVDVPKGDEFIKFKINSYEVSKI